MVSHPDPCERPVIRHYAPGRPHLPKNATATSVSERTRTCRLPCSGYLIRQDSLGFARTPSALLDGALGRSDGFCIPSYRFPEAAAIALARAASYGEWRSRPLEPPPQLAGLCRTEALAIVATALARGPGWLEVEETQRLLACYGLPVLEVREVGRSGAAGALQTPVALKARLSGAAHMSEVGGVRLGLATPESVRLAAVEIERTLADRGVPSSGFLIQPMAQAGLEMIVGVVHDCQFGPVIACGAGGPLVELLRDVAVRLAPLSASDVDEMIASLKSFTLLTGYRGRPAADITALKHTLLRVSALVEDVPEIAELDLNPVLLHAEGASIVDARVRVEMAEPQPPLGARTRPLTGRQ